MITAPNQLDAAISELKEGILSRLESNTAHATKMARQLNNMLNNLRAIKNKEDIARTSQSEQAVKAAQAVIKLVKDLDRLEE